MVYRWYFLRHIHWLSFSKPLWGILFCWLPNFIQYSSCCDADCKNSVTALKNKLKCLGTLSFDITECFVWLFKGEQNREVRGTKPRSITGLIDRNVMETIHLAFHQQNHECCHFVPSSLLVMSFKTSPGCVTKNQIHHEATCFALRHHW